MWLLGKENINKLSSVIATKYYTEWVRSLETLLIYSRQKEYYEDPANLLALQLALAKSIAQGESLVVEGTKRRNEVRDKGDIKLAQDLDSGVTSNRQIARIAKVISDGLAWRVLDFDRPFLRVMSESKRHFGSVELSKPTYKGTEEVAVTIVAHGNRVLLNDLTHFLRIGDLVEVGERTIIHEIKNSGGKIKNVYSLARHPRPRKLSKQLRSLVTAQAARDFRVIDIGSNEVEIRELSISYQNNLGAIADLINQARKNLYSYTEFGDYLAVSCSDYEQMVDVALKTKEHIWERFNDKPNWNRSDMVLDHSNMDAFFDYGGDFLRCSTPYSIYPFGDKDCIDLISGKLFLHSRLNVSAIKRLLIKNGWEIIEIDIAEARKRNELIKPKLFTGELFQFSVDDTIFGIRRGKFSVNVPYYWIQMICTEFMKPETLIEEAETIFKQWDPEKERVFVPYIKDEKNVWR